MVTNSKQVSVAAARYAKSLFELSVEKECVLDIQKSLNDILNHIFNQKDFQKIISMPCFTKAHQRNFFSVIFPVSKQTSTHKKLISQFLNVLICHKRFPIFEEIVSIFNRFVQNSKNEIVVTLRTAFHLTDSGKKDLLRTLESLTKKTVLLQETIDPSLIGGFIIRMGSYQIDASLRQKLNSLSYVLKEVN